MILISFRPKGRGRPQRILLGVWPDEHIRGVIRTVVFRDNTHSTDRQLLNNERFQGNDKIALVDEESSVLQVRDEADLLCLNNQNLSNSTKTELFPNDNSSYHKDVSEYKDQLHKYCTLNKIMLTPQASTLDPTLWVTIAQRQRYMSEAEVHHSSLLVRSGMCLAESPTTGDVYVAPTESRDSPSPAAFDLSGTYSLPVPYNYGNKFPPTVAELGPGSSFVQKERHPADLPETVRCQTNVSLPNIAETSEIKDTNSLKLSP
ncbi:uncharacterized protein LOC113371246 [Ctenocephalides felis]|uniref:uncharacterized protein LOC113371246 n=1 Tax=Ctenocephalides felis TaxID=7515 RepID=UPI000E6E4888|nr:uncharacterized protein LOC113371246 [Ctenocephalides felis]